MDYMKFYRLYKERWFTTNYSMFWKNLVSSVFVFGLCCYAVKEDVFVTYEATKSACFSCLMALIWSGIFNSIGLYNAEADYTNDALNKSLPLSVYMLGSLSVQLRLCLIQAIACTAIFTGFFDYGKEGLVLPFSAIDYGITFFLILISADMLGLALGTFVNSIGTALSVIPVALIAQFLLSGSLFELSGVLEYVSKFTSAKFGFEAFGSIANLNDESLPLTISQIYPQIIKQANDLFDYSASYVVSCWGHLLLLGILAFVLSFLSLFIKINKKR